MRNRKKRAARVKRELNRVGNSRKRGRGWAARQAARKVNNRK